MSDADTVLAGLLPLLPAATSLAIFVAGRHVPAIGCRWISIGSFLASLLLLVGLAAQGTELLDGAVVVLHRWIAIEEPPAVIVAIALQFDRAALGVVATMLVAGLGLLLSTSLDDEAISKRFHGIAGLTMTSALLVILAPNVVQWWIFLHLTLVGAVALVGLNSQSAADVLAARRVLLLNRVGDIFSILGLLLAWMLFESVHFDAICGRGIYEPSPRLLELLAADLPDDESAANEASIVMVAFCLLAGAAVRCGQFPLFGWLQGVSRGRSTTNALIQAAFLLPAGAWILFRAAPLIAVSQTVCGVMAFLGAFTVVLSAAAALAEDDAEQSLSCLSAGWFGFLFLGIATGTTTGLHAALLLLIVHGPARAVLSLTIGGRRNRSAMIASTGQVERWFGGIASLVLLSGLCGQHEILSAAWNEAGENSAQGFGAGLLGPSVGCAVAGWFLQSLALARLWLRSSTPEVSISSDVDKRVGPIVGLTLVAIAAAGVFGASPKKFLGAPSTDSSIRPILGVGVELLIVLLGVVLAWMASTRAMPMGLASTLDSLSRSSRRRFYLDDLAFIVVVMPIRGLAQIARFLDWFLVDGLLVGLPTRLPSLFARSFEPLQGKPARLSILAVFLALGVLLLVLAKP